jgi:hypothetical protein
MSNNDQYIKQQAIIALPLLFNPACRPSPISIYILLICIYLHEGDAGAGSGAAAALLRVQVEIGERNPLRSQGRLLVSAGSHSRRLLPGQTQPQGPHAPSHRRCPLRIAHRSGSLRPIHHRRSSRKRTLTLICRRLILEDWVGGGL